MFQATHTAVRAPVRVQVRVPRAPSLSRAMASSAGARARGREAADPAPEAPSVQRQRVSDAELPDALRNLALQFVDGDTHGVVSDLGQSAQELVEAAWDGRLCESIISERIPICDAINRSTAQLDAAAMAFMVGVPGEMTQAGMDFDNTSFMRDVVASFSSLKACTFEGLCTVHFDHLQAALTMTESTWR